MAQPQKPTTIAHAMAKFRGSAKPNENTPTLQNHVKKDIQFVSWMNEYVLYTTHYLINEYNTYAHIHTYTYILTIKYIILDP